MVFPSGWRTAKKTKVFPSDWTAKMKGFPSDWTKAKGFPSDWTKTKGCPPDWTLRQQPRIWR